MEQHERIYIIKPTFRLERLDLFIIVACSGKEQLVPELQCTWLLRIVLLAGTASGCL